MPNVYRLLRNAVLNRRQVSLTHSGHRREVCPHILGTKHGEAHVLVFQFAGGSSSGLPPGGDWRCLKVADISDASSRAGAWHSRRHTEPQRCVDAIDVQVSD